MAIDPVCSMHVDEATAKWTLDYEGETYYFCSPGCLSAFREQPSMFLEGDSEESSQEHHRM